MVQYTSELYGQLQAGIQQISQVPGSVLAKAESCFILCCQHLRELKEFISGYSFKDQQEEIQFYKELKPQFLKEMHYYLKLIQVEARRPVGTPEDTAGYYRNQIREIGAYMERNHILYLYYKKEANHWDDKLFVKEPEGVFMLSPEYHYSDGPGNIYSYKLAKIQAYEELTILLQGLILDPGSQITQAQGGKGAAPPLSWKGTQAQFYEWVLGVVKSGVLGDISMKVAMEWLGYCVAIKVGHYYRYLQVMRIRKKIRTPFLKKCMEAAEAYMDECDENPKYH